MSNMDEWEESELRRIGKRISDLRKVKGVSQSKLAQLTNINSSNIGKIELGKYNPGFLSLCKIGKALDSELDFLQRD